MSYVRRLRVESGITPTVDYLVTDAAPRHAAEINASPGRPGQDAPGRPHLGITTRQTSCDSLDQTFTAISNTRRDCIARSLVVPLPPLLTSSLRTTLVLMLQTLTRHLSPGDICLPPKTTISDICPGYNLRLR